jgi:Haemolymph juvenile hormone binding protein (JHBP)
MSLLPAIKQKQEGIALPAIDPFTYESVTFNYKNSQILTGSFTVRNVKSFGLSRAKIRTLKSNVTDNTLTITTETFIPKLFSTGKYNSSMKFNALQIDSRGQFNVTMKDIKAKWTMKGKLENINGEDYMKVYKFDLLPEANEMKISVSGLFPDEALSEYRNFVSSRGQI